MHDERAAPFVSLVPEVDRFKSFHLVETNGSSFSRGAAVIASLSAMRRTRYLGRVLAALRMTRFVDLLYGAVAKSRDHLGRFVRDEPGPDRFSG